MPSKIKSNTSWADLGLASPYDDSPDAEIASDDELNLVVNTGQVTPNTPNTQFNPNMPYANIVLNFNDKDKILVEAVRKAIMNGWVGWRSMVNDATTIGLEAEAMVIAMKKTNASARDLLFSQEFASSLWGENYKEKLQQMVIAPDAIMFLKDNT